MESMRSAHSIFRKLIALEMPTPSILCIAAILGSVSNAIAFTKAHTVLSWDTIPSQFLVIIPAKPQQQVPLSLPPKQPKSNTHLNTSQTPKLH
ncbi:MAG: hypothetical protein PVF82_10570 [Gammaproteobacteria bacterium]